MSTKRKFKLKPRPDDGYPPRLCAAEDCDRESEYIDATRNFWDFEVPLCNIDYERRPPAPVRVPEPKSEPVKEVEEAPSEYELSQYTQLKARAIEDIENADSPKSHKLFG